MSHFPVFVALHGAVMSKTIEEIYQKKTPLEQILLRPDSHVGSMEPRTSDVWVCDVVALEPTSHTATDTEADPTPDPTPDPNVPKPARKKPAAVAVSVSQRSVTVIPAFVKLFDELLVNCCDLAARNPDDLTRIDVTVDTTANRISVRNTGKGVPVVMHQTEKVYVPELIFGHLFSGSNYDDTKERTTGGRNGEGAKLTNIFSTSFTVETVDVETRKKYIQTWNDNMSRMDKEKITASGLKTGYTIITYEPDLTRFPPMTDDVVALLRRRVLDVGGLLGSRVKVTFNEVTLSLPSFKRYCELYHPPFLLMDDPGTEGSGSIRWQVGVSASPTGTFQHVSFVNSIATERGGTHVDACVLTLVNALMKHLEKKKVELSALAVKNQLWVFVNCTLVNPSFDSQTKEFCNLPAKAFGSRWTPSEAFLEKVCKSSIFDTLKEKSNEKAMAALKRTDGSKVSVLVGIGNGFTDANWAGTKRSGECTLILCEGQSAKNLIMAGISSLKDGRDRFGVYPMRGVGLNARDADPKRIGANQELTDFKRILGLKQGVEYKDASALRYGHVMLATDADFDGSKIKGLLLSDFEFLFPSLGKIPGFFLDLLTPIVRANKGKEVRFFYAQEEADRWISTLSTREKSQWEIKHMKGMGSSSSSDAQHYFADLAHHIKRFKPCDAEAHECLDMAFNRKRAEDRKQWLANFVPGTFLDPRQLDVSIPDFVNKDLIRYCIYANERCIPNVVDGLKPASRKVLYACFKRNLTTQLKVSQLGGYVADVSQYNHGEASLGETIVGMAQDFVGSNNIPYLEPHGQFGSRHTGASEHAATRYIFTCLSPMTRLLFSPDDDELLEYLVDDGKSVEPRYYVPALPMLLVNGSTGIGVGWSSTVPSFNPLDLITRLRARLTGSKELFLPLEPWTRGWTGTLESVSSTKWKARGTWRRIDPTTIEITELPVGVWSQTVKDDIDAMMVKGEVVKGVTEHHGESTVHFRITLLKPLEDAEIERLFKLTDTITTTNMVCFTPEGRLCRYASAEDILDAYFPVRLDLYAKRREALLKRYTAEWTRADARARFVLAVVSDDLKMGGRRKRDEVVADLKRRKFPEIGGTDDDGEGSSSGGGYGYLLSMPMSSLTDEKVVALEKERDRLATDIKVLTAKSPAQLWIEDLERIERGLTGLKREGSTGEAGSVGGIGQTLASGGLGKKPRKPATVRKTAPPK